MNRILCLFVAFICFVGFLSRGPVARADDLFDLRSQIYGKPLPNDPTTYQKTLYIIADLFPNAVNGTAFGSRYCYVKFNYNMNTGFSIVETGYDAGNSVTRAKLFLADGVNITNAHTMLNMCTPDFANTTGNNQRNEINGAYVTAGNKQLVIQGAVPSVPNFAPANMIIISGADDFGVTMRERTTSNHTQYFGGQAFPLQTNSKSVSAGLKIDQYLTLKCLLCDPAYSASSTSLGSQIGAYQPLRLAITITPQEETVKANTCFDALPPSNNSACAAKCSALCPNKMYVTDSSECPFTETVVNGTTRQYYCPSIGVTPKNNKALNDSASKFRMVLSHLAWHAPECMRPHSASYKYCDKITGPVPGVSGKTYNYDNRFFYVVFQFFTQFSSQPKPAPYANGEVRNDDGTGAALYAVDLSKLTITPPPSCLNSDCNPFQDGTFINRQITLTVEDLRPQLATIINKVYDEYCMGIDRRMADGSKMADGSPGCLALPPKVCALASGDRVFCNETNGEPATMEAGGHYASRFFLKNVTVGYEVTGLSRLSYKVNDFKISGTPCSTTDPTAICFPPGP